MEDTYGGAIIFALLIAGGVWWYTYHGPEENTGGWTQNYYCAYEANKLADESQAIADRMVGMGCSGVVVDQALYTRCIILSEENRKINEQWKALSCTDDSKAPF